MGDFASVDTWCMCKCVSAVMFPCQQRQTLAWSVFTHAVRRMKLWGRS